MIFLGIVKELLVFYLLFYYTFFHHYLIEIFFIYFYALELLTVNNWQWQCFILPPRKSMDTKVDFPIKINQSLVNQNLVNILVENHKRKVNVSSS